jgi:SAM-dependent methyltransferase
MGVYFDGFFMKATELAHFYWKRVIQPGDCVIDATCGNGKDSLFLADLIGDQGTLIGMDIQKEAVEKTGKLLEQRSNCHLFLQSHHEFPALAVQKKIKLIAYNLGYLPGGDKKITTQTSSTLESVKKALTLIVPGGLLSITCYPGHPEGALEEEALLKIVSCLPSKGWAVTHHRWVNWPAAPSLLLLEKRIT